MVNAQKKNFSPLPAGRNGKSTKRSTQRRHQANEGKSGFEAESPSPWGIALLEIQEEAHVGKTMRNPLLKQ